MNFSKLTYLLRIAGIATGLTFSIHLFAQATNELPVLVSQLSRADIAGPFVAEALRNNPGLAAHDKRYQAARTTIDSAAVLPNPNIQLTHFVESIQTRTGPQRQALMIQQPIPGFGKRGSRRDIAQRQSEALWHAYAVQQFKLVDDVSERVFEIAYLDKSIAITRQNQDLLRQLESIVEDKVKSGGDLADLLKLQVEIVRYDDQIARLETMRAGTTYTLEAVLGREASDRRLQLEWQAPSHAKIDTTSLLRSVLERSPQLAVLRSLESSQEARERLARYANRPDFTVGINYIRTGDAINSSMQGSGTDPWAVMLGVSLPIWGKANNAIALQASLEQEAISAQISDLELQLQANAKTQLAKFEDANARIRRYETELIPLARQTQEIVHSSYASNKATILDTIDSERTLLKLETEYWRAAADAWQARWKLATLSGGIWIE